MNRPTPSRLLLALVLLSAIAASMKPLIEIVRTVSVMRAVPRGARRERLMGPFYASMLRIAREIPPNERLALFPLRPEHYDAALFFDYYVYPHPTRIYRDVAAYRADRNAPATIIEIGDEPVRRTYAEVLARQAGQGAVLSDATLLARVRDAGRWFSVPLVASLHGAPPAFYVTEAILVSQAPAVVTITMHPAGRVASVTVDHDHPARFYDLVGQLFTGIDRGWIEVESTAPLRATFWFVNRGTRSANEMTIVVKPPARLHIGTGHQLWLVNLGSTQADLRVNGRKETLDRYGLITRTVDCPCDVTTAGSGARVYGFTSEKLADGGTRFVWPEARP